jgi:cell division protein FtsA
MTKKNSIIAGLDLGTSKVVCIVGELSKKGLQIIGVGVAESEGMRKGMVINIGKTVDSIRKAVKAAEHMAGCEITNVVAGVGGAHILGVNNHGMVSVKKKEISKEDLARVIDAAKAYPISVDRCLIYVFPQQYSVDGNDSIKDPIGISGVRLDVDVHLITASHAALDNIMKCAERSGLSVSKVISHPLASSYAVLEENEKELGVAMLDIGAGTSNLAIWINGGLFHAEIIGKGGHLITEDIARGLRTPVGNAEEIKKSHGCAMSALIESSEMIDIPSVGGRPNKTLRRQILTEIIEPRMEEILNDCYSSIQATGLEDLLGAGIVITGGTSSLPGVAELGESITNLPVRIGLPGNVNGLSDLITSGMFSTAYGLLLCEEKMIQESLPTSIHPLKPHDDKGGIFSIFKKVANLIFSI